MSRHKPGTLVWVRDSAISERTTFGSANKDYVEQAESRMLVVRSWGPMHGTPGLDPAYLCASIVNGVESYWFPKEIIAASRRKLTC